MNNEIRAAIRPVKARVEDELIARPGVNAVDIAEKVTNGEPTGELSIVVYVDRKLPAARVGKDNAIPAEIDGIRTDVQEMTIELQSPRWERLEADRLVDTGTYTPLVGGISMGPTRSFFLEPPEVPAPGNYVMVGTLGALVKDNATGQTMALSNFHVAAVDTGWSTSDRQCQPGRPDGGVPPGAEFGTLARAVISEHVDGSVTRLDSGRAWKAEVQGIGEVAGPAAAVLNQPVRKRGRTTELTYGTVASLDFTVSVDFGDGVGVRTLRNQLRITTDTSRSTRFSDRGDSGSVIMTDDRHVVGLLFAGSTDGANTFANPISDVLSELDVTLLTGGFVPIFTKPVVCPPSKLVVVCPTTPLTCWSRTVLCKPSVLTICVTRQVFCPTKPVICNEITRMPICMVSGPICEGPPGGPVENPVDGPIGGQGDQVDYGYGEADVYTAGYAEGFAAGAEAVAQDVAVEQAAEQQAANLPWGPSRPVFTCPSVVEVVCPTRPPICWWPTRYCSIITCTRATCLTRPVFCEQLPFGAGQQSGQLDASFWAGYLAALEQQQGGGQQ